MMANALARHHLHPCSRRSRIGACLGLAFAILTAAASAKSCQRQYIIEDQTTSSITAFFYEQNGQWSRNLLASIVSSGRRQMVIIVGNGASQYKAVLSGNREVLGQTSDICALSNIVIFQNGGVPHMVIR